VKKIIQEIIRSGKLKRLPRMGWRLRGVIPCESVADHSFRVCLITMLLGDALHNERVELDRERLLRIAILHELAEAMLTDLAKEPVELLGKKAKHSAENKAMQTITAGLPDGKEYRSLWLEFEENSTLEGKIVRVADRLDMMVQALEYGQAGWRNLDDFWNNQNNFEDFGIPLIKDIWRELKKQHKDSK